MSMEPSSTETPLRSNLTEEFSNTVIEAPAALIFACEELPVSTMSPGKTTEECAIAAPFSDVDPLTYTIAPPGSAASREPGVSKTIAQHNRFWRANRFITDP